VEIECFVLASTNLLVEFPFFVCRPQSSLANEVHDNKSSSTVDDFTACCECKS
jgi:hypothetical protein